MFVLILFGASYSSIVILNRPKAGEESRELRLSIFNEILRREYPSG